MASDMFSRRAIERRLGMQDARGPQGMFSRGANVYRGGLPNAQSGSGNPNIGRPANPAQEQPSMQGVGGGMGAQNPSLTALVGSLPPLAGNPDQGMNDAVMTLLKQRIQKRVGMA